MNQDVTMRSKDTHNAITRHYVEMAERYADLKVDAASWTTDKASGSCAYVFAYLQVDCNLSFPGGPNLTFNGKGMVVGLGATGSLGGQATFNVDPNTLKGASGISFEATSVGVVGGGFQVTWFKNGKYIGHGEFYGLGVQLGTPGGGWGSFS
ncbi:hypothetical protein QP938_12240 [Porticoccaceae bacterium LTM1]|nr:hypothetical protein QP938_12240 [Porticoccaceae bacterium LTM1]